VQVQNFEVCTGDEFPWSVYASDADPQLDDVVVEVRPRWKPTDTSAELVVDAQNMAQVLLRHWLGVIVTEHERFVVSVDGVEYVARVVEVSWCCTFCRTLLSISEHPGKARDDLIISG